jgi:ribose-phosphate pyrophosphokinase
VGPLALVTGSGGSHLAADLAAALGMEPLSTRIGTFPDGEIDVAVAAAVAGRDVYVVQSIGPPVNDRLVETLLLLDGCRRAGAERITAVIPYLGYARKDRRNEPGDAVSLRVVADALETAGAGRAVLLDPHVGQVDSVFSIPLEVISAVEPLAGAVAAAVPGNAVVVAPDLGAVHLAERFAGVLGTERTALVRKQRLSGSDVEVGGLVGDGRERPVLIVDDMITTGSTIAAAVEAVVAEWSPAAISVAATHGLFVGEAVERLDRLPLATMAVSDSVVPAAVPARCRTVGIAALLAGAIERLHGDGT